MITDSQRMARESFDLDAAIEALPSHGAVALRDQGSDGRVRLRGHLVADISDDLLREFARDSLRAKRCSEQYLDALRIVLGNQADAERCGYVLEMNQRVSFAPQRIMRTIIDQMQAARVSYGTVVGLGKGRSQVVQCFANEERRHRVTTAGMTNEGATAELERLDRKQEASDDARREAAMALGRHPQRCNWCSTIPEAEVPY